VSGVTGNKEIDCGDLRCGVAVVLHVDRCVRG
jgi:hypothetical protein